MLKRILGSVAAIWIALSGCIIVLAESRMQEPASVVSAETLAYLDSQTPGPRSVIVSSLTGRSPRKDATEALKENLRDWSKNGLPSVLEYETALLSFIKLQESLKDFNNTDLLAKLYSQELFKNAGLDAVAGALLVYEASGEEVSQSQPNSPNSLIDRIISSQQSSGGFALYPGNEPDIVVTAMVLTVLMPYHYSGTYIQSCINKALNWLNTQQNGDGTFSVKGLPSGKATAWVLTAVSLYESQPSAFLKGGGLEMGMDRFLRSDGGYSEILGGPSSPEVTELAVIGKYVASTGSFPYYAPEHYPGYVEPPAAPPEQAASPWQTYGKFLLGFIGVFFIIYLLLMLTIQIGKYGERKKLPGSLARKTEKQSQTMQMHIPMQVEMPDFNKIPETESEIGHIDDNDVNH